MVETAVGDRYVLEAMKAGGFGLGGEQSGHVIMLDHATTGDGTLTAPAARGPDGRDRAARWRTSRRDGRLPQVLVNVAGVDSTGVDVRRCWPRRCRRRGGAGRHRAGAAAASAAPSRWCG